MVIAVDRGRVWNSNSVGFPFIPLVHKNEIQLFEAGDKSPVCGESVGRGNVCGNQNGEIRWGERVLSPKSENPAYGRKGNKRIEAVVSAFWSHRECSTYMNGLKIGTVWSAATPFGLEWSHRECPASMNVFSTAISRAETRISPFIYNAYFLGRIICFRSDDSQVPKKCCDDSQVPKKCSDDSQVPKKCSDEGTAEGGKRRLVIPIYILLGTIAKCIVAQGSYFKENTK
ncbi:hypothetical protein AVEN_100873-1 [Araneus ventricosus]|uniref:Uncharacterized protein n=1 Tax=Araneus ventricosus TaxID=182803 RepID=A0A4Y2AXM9_ARAVE|nr:hypothetical protein AVEN_100873-1 [Araneus ventricosus]